MLVSGAVLDLRIDDPYNRLDDPIHRKTTAIDAAGWALGIGEEMNGSFSLVQITPPVSDTVASLVVDQGYADQAAHAVCPALAARLDQAGPAPDDGVLRLGDPTILARLHSAATLTAAAPPDRPQGPRSEPQRRMDLGVLHWVGLPPDPRHAWLDATGHLSTRCACAGIADERVKQGILRAPTCECAEMATAFWMAGFAPDDNTITDWLDGTWPVAIASALTDAHWDQQHALDLRDRVLAFAPGWVGSAFGLPAHKVHDAAAWDPFLAWVNTGMEPWDVLLAVRAGLDPETARSASRTQIAVLAALRD